MHEDAPVNWFCSIGQLKIKDVAKNVCTHFCEDDNTTTTILKPYWKQTSTGNKTQLFCLCCLRDSVMHGGVRKSHMSVQNYREWGDFGQQMLSRVTEVHWAKASLSHVIHLRLTPWRLDLNSYSEDSRLNLKSHSEDSRLGLNSHPRDSILNSDLHLDDLRFDLDSHPRDSKLNSDSQIRDLKLKLDLHPRDSKIDSDSHLRVDSES